jgi:hypothetical protein
MAIVAGARDERLPASSSPDFTASLRGMLIQSADVPPAVPRECPQCHVGVGVVHAVQTVPDRSIVFITMTCQSCQHEWQIERSSPTVEAGNTPLFGNTAS